MTAKIAVKVQWESEHSGNLQFLQSRPLKWGTFCLWIPTGSKMARRQSLMIEKHVSISSKKDGFFVPPTLPAGHFGTSGISET